MILQGRLFLPVKASTVMLFALVSMLMHLQGLLSWMLSLTQVSWDACTVT
jgi:hypothetical protein